MINIVDMNKSLPGSYHEQVQIYVELSNNL